MSTRSPSSLFAVIVAAAAALAALGCGRPAGEAAETRRSELDPALDSCLREFERCASLGDRPVEHCALELLACGRSAVDAGLDDPLTAAECETLHRLCVEEGLGDELCRRGQAECEHLVPAPDPGAPVLCAEVRDLCLGYGFTPGECELVRADCEGAGGPWPTAEDCEQASTMCALAGHPEALCSAVRTECDRRAVPVPVPDPEPDSAVECDSVHGLCVASGFEEVDCAMVRARCAAADGPWPTAEDCADGMTYCLARGYAPELCESAFALCGSGF